MCHVVYIVQLELTLENIKVLVHIAHVDIIRTEIDKEAVWHAQVELTPRKKDQNQLTVVFQFAVLAHSLPRYYSFLFMTPNETDMKIIRFVNNVRRKMKLQCLMRNLFINRDWFHV